MPSPTSYCSKLDILLSTEIGMAAKVTPLVSVFLGGSGNPVLTGEVNLADLAKWRHKYKTLDGKEHTIPCLVSTSWP